MTVPAVLRRLAPLVLLSSLLATAPAAMAATTNVTPGPNALQTAITAAAPGDTLNLAAGTYSEQVDIAKNLTITGAGAATTTISAPGSMVTKSGALKPVVYVHGATVTLSGVTVDGLRSGATNSELVGVMFHNASGSLTHSTVTGTRDATIAGGLRGFAVLASDDNASAQTVTVSDTVVNDYQRSGIRFSGAGLTGIATNNVVTGTGEIYNAQNGILLLSGAAGSITGNTVSDNRCLVSPVCGPDFFSQSQSFGILLLDTGAATVANNTSTNNDGGIDLDNLLGATTVSGNTLTANRYEGIFDDGGSMSATGNVISGGINGLAIVSYEGYIPPTGSFTGNRISATTGPAVLITQDTPLADAPAVGIHANRFAATGVAVSSDAIAAQDATGNWWGCNAGPGAVGCATKSGLVNSASQLQLALTASPATILPNGTSTLTASFGSSAFPTVTVAFAKTAGDGSLTPASAPTSSGSAQSVFTAGASDGSSTVSATFEGQTVETTVTAATPVVTPPTPPAPTPPGPADNAPTGDNAPPSTPPAVQPPVAGELTTVAGTLGGGTQTVEVTNSSNDPGTTELAVNLAGAGTLIITSGDQTITVTVADDGTTTITPEGGEPIVVSGADGKTPGTVEIKVTPDGVTYTLSDPGSKTVKIGETTLTVPGTATIQKSAGKTTYDIKGEGICIADLDPAVSNDFTSGQNVQCTIDQGVGGAGRRSVTAAAAAKSRRDSIRTGSRNDRISAGPGADSVSSGGGNDLVRGDRSLAVQGLTASARRAYTAAIKRVSGPDRLHGEAGNDRIYGDGANDTIWGGTGNDHLFGNLGDDHISGGVGDDVIDGGAGRDVIYGGAGNDLIRSKSNGKDTISCGAGRDTVLAGPFDVVFTDCERVVRH
ncbi:MAG: nitrous oxidase accessory protein [Actinomycetia bacterium]|nr:nitrous oxidase accessory protein [Actinomycetes bacterium]